MKFELQPYHRNVPDDDMLGDLKTVAAKVAPAPLTRDTYDSNGKFSGAGIAKRFGSWTKALIAAGLSPSRRYGISVEDLIADIRRVAQLLGSTTLTQAEYLRRGKFTERVVRAHFTSWKVAARSAGVEHGWNYQLSDDELFDNMERVWRHLGRQPTSEEMIAPLSKYSRGVYVNRFGGFRKALEAFVAAVSESKGRSSPDPSAFENPSDGRSGKTPKTPRTVGWRLRFLTLRRDGFKCRACGKSPAKDPGVELVVDHVMPWSDGGETVLENLQSLCEPCNGGKSNLSWELE